MKVLLPVAILIAWSVSPLYGQASSDENLVSITVNATVQTLIETITIQAIELDGSERDNSVIFVNPTESPRAGKIIARGTPESEFRVEFMRDQLLNNADGKGFLIFNYILAVSQTNDQSSAELFEPDARELSFNSQGEFFIWVGGAFDIDQVYPGSYEGEFSIEIEYL